MKINDVILSEAPAAPRQGVTGQKLAQTSGGQFMTKADRTNQAKVDAALGPGFKAGSKEANLALAKKFGQPAADPNQAAVDAANATNAAAVAKQKEIEAGPQSSTVAGEQPAAPAPAAAPDVDPSIDPYDPNKDTNVTQVAGSDGTTPDLDRLKQLAIGQNTLNQQASQQGAAMAKAAQGAAAPAEKPRDASTVPAAALGQRTTTDVSPDTGLSTAPVPVKGTSNVVTGSDDEMAWRAKNPNWQYLPPNQQYPGPGQWDPKTGRSKKLQAQADANAAAVKGFLNKINPFAKKEPTVNLGPGSPGYTPNPAIDQMSDAEVNQKFKQINQSVDNNPELGRIKKLSGL